MYRLVVSHFQPMRRYHTVEHQLACKAVIEVSVLSLLRIDILLQGQPVSCLFGGCRNFLRNLRNAVAVLIILHFLRVCRTHGAQQKGEHKNYSFHFTLDLVVYKNVCKSVLILV